MLDMTRWEIMTVTGIKLTDRPGSQSQIVESIFGVKLSDDQAKNYQSYLEYYSSEINLLYAGLAEETRQVSTLAIKNCEDIFYIIDVLVQNQGFKRPQLRQYLDDRFPSANTVEINRSINLALRLWLMINIQETDFQKLRTEATCISWNDTTSLEVFIGSIFPVARWELNASTSRLGPHFTAAFMEKVCGLTLIWTTSIHDHLKLNRSKKTLKIFAFKCHTEGLLARGQHNEGPIPIPVLEETLLSLDLLFPIWDPDTTKMLKRENQTFHFRGQFSSRPASLLDFNHWRDRLLDLQEILNSPPVSWAQLWKDRRNPQQFWTFWIALVILILTVISTVTGMVQAWASIQALK